MEILPAFTPLAVASSVIIPPFSALCTSAVSCPLNSFIFGVWKLSRLEGLPLATALNVPAPLTLKLISRF